MAGPRLQGAPRLALTDLATRLEATIAAVRSVTSDDADAISTLVGAIVAIASCSNHPQDLFAIAAESLDMVRAKRPRSAGGLLS
jgi:hypothetical protein